MSWTSFTHDIKYWGADEWKIIKLPINPFNLSSVAKFGPTAVIYNKYNIAAPQKMYNLSEFSCKNVNWWKFIGRVGAAVVEATFITITSPSLASKQERVRTFFFKDIFFIMPHHGRWWYFCFVWLLVVLVGFSQNPPAISQCAAFPPNLQHPTLAWIEKGSASQMMLKKKTSRAVLHRSHVQFMLLCSFCVKKVAVALVDTSRKWQI